MPICQVNGMDKKKTQQAFNPTEGLRTQLTTIKLKANIIIFFSLCLPLSLSIFLFPKQVLS